MSPAVPLVAAIVLLGLNLRPVLASIGPMLDQIQQATGLGDVGASLLTTLPVFAMGLGALAGGRLATRVSTRGGIAVAMLLVAVACALRAVADGAMGLVATAVLAGVGIAGVQTLLPAVIRQHLSSSADRVMAMYTTGIMGGAAVAAAASPWLAQHQSWQAALAWWALPALLGAVVWAAVFRGRSHSQAPQAASPAQAPGWTRARVWLLIVFFGLATSAYTLVLAWLPPFYTALGWTPAQSGLLLGFITVMEVVAGLTVSTVIHRFPDRRPAITLCLVLTLVGLIGLLSAPGPLAIPVAVLLGLGIGGVFPLTLIVTLDHARNGAQAGQLLGWVQGGGYLIASAMPLAAGMLRAALSDLRYAWMLMAAGIVALLVMAVRLRPAGR